MTNTSQYDEWLHEDAEGNSFPANKADADSQLEVVAVETADGTTIKAAPQLCMVCIPPELKSFALSMHPSEMVRVATLLAGLAWFLLSSWFTICVLKMGEDAAMVFMIGPIVITTGLLFLWQQYREFPTNLECSVNGLVLAWKKSRHIYSKPIPWGAVLQASIEDGEIFAGKDRGERTIALDIDLKGLPWLRRVAISLQTQSLWRDRKNFGNNLLRLRFPLRSLTLEADKIRFAAFLQSQLEPRQLDSSLADFCHEKGTPSYTQLWLENVQSFHRKRTNALAPDDVLADGKYKVQEVLAIGGQARIYRAIDREGQAVALKEFVLPTNGGAGVRNDSMAHIQNEASFLETLRHPSIVQLLEHFVEDHRAYLVLEFIEGTTLRQQVKDLGPKQETEVISVLSAALEICRYFHTQAPPVVHRDLTPDNFIQSPQGVLKLIDFSVAQFMEAERTRTVCGKHNYMAPEQFQGKPCPQSDLYSLGCTTYFLLTGEDPLPLSCLKVPSELGVSLELSQIVSKLTKFSLEDRYQTAEEMLKDLAQLADLSD